MLGLTPEQADAVAEMMAEVEAATEAKASAAISARRENDRKRKAEQRDRENIIHVMSRDVTGRDVTSCDGADRVGKPPGKPADIFPNSLSNPPSPPTGAQTPTGVSSNRGTRLPDDWQPKPRHFAKAIQLGLNESWVLGKADDLRTWARANSNRPIARKADWDATFDGFLKRDAAERGGRANGARAGPRRDTEDIRDPMAAAAARYLDG